MSKARRRLISLVGSDLDDTLGSVYRLASVPHYRPPGLWASGPLWQPDPLEVPFWSVMRAVGRRRTHATQVS